MADSTDLLLYAYTFSHQMKLLCADRMILVKSYESVLSTVLEPS